MSIIEKAVNWAVSIANDNSHGYSQTNRNGNPDYDCSSLVINAMKYAGINVGNAYYTGNMKSEFTAHDFVWIPWSQIGSTANLKRGDVLLRGGVFPHAGVHRRRDPDRRLRGERHGGEKVVRNAVRHLRDHVRRCRGDHQHVRRVGKR